MLFSWKTSLPKKAAFSSVHEVEVQMTCCSKATTPSPRVLYFTQRSCPLSWEDFKKWSGGFFPQDVQGINNNSPKKVGTILKHYFYFVHRRGLLYGKAVGVELSQDNHFYFTLKQPTRHTKAKQRLKKHAQKNIVWHWYKPSIFVTTNTQLKNWQV